MSKDDDTQQPETDPAATKAANQAIKRARDDQGQTNIDPGTAHLVRGYGDLAQEREAANAARTRRGEDEDDDED